jgi:hypothetical protein
MHRSSNWQGGAFSAESGKHKSFNEHGEHSQLEAA